MPGAAIVIMRPGRQKPSYATDSADCYGLVLNTQSQILSSKNKLTKNKKKSWTMKHIFKETDLPILQVKLTDFKQRNEQRTK